MDIIIFCLGPIVAVILGAVLITFALQKMHKFASLLIVVGTVLFSLICYWLFTLASYGDMGPFGAFAIGVICAGIAVICGIWMAWRLKTWRKLAAVLVGVVFPLTLFFSVQFGEAQSPEKITRQNAEEIVVALLQYQEKYGQFPSALSRLEPEFFVTLPEALTSQHTGWLYETKDDRFTFAYWKWPEKYGSWVCLYDSTNSTWNCELNNWGPFKPVPTPWPCENEDGIWVDTADCK
jgi:hypothetical protein